MAMANKVVARMAIVCERIEIAGSLRRGNKVVGDIEIVAIPKMTRTGLFKDQEHSSLDSLLRAFEIEGKIKEIRAGAKLKCYDIMTVTPTMRLDLFIANQDNWGLILAIRTGPAEYSKHLVTQRFKGGALDNDHKVHAGFVWRSYDRPISPSEKCGNQYRYQEIDGLVYEKQPVAEETDFFELIDGGYVEPNKRRYK